MADKIQIFDQIGHNLCHQKTNTTSSAGTHCIASNYIPGTPPLHKITSQAITFKALIAVKSQVLHTVDLSGCAKVSNTT